MSASDALSDLGQAQLRIDEEMKVLQARGMDDTGRYWQLSDVLETVTTCMIRLDRWLEGVEVPDAR